MQTKENDAHLRHGSYAQSGAPVSQGSTVDVPNTARSRKQERFTALLHHLTIDLLRESYFALKRRAAPGVDGVSWQQYEDEPGGAGLSTSIVGCIAERIGHNPRGESIYRKLTGRQRPLGIASLEDKIVQQAVVTILNQIYEVDFRGFSYGFRPGRSPHQALDALNVGIERKRVNWILDADIRGFFDHLSHEWMMKFVEHRVADTAHPSADHVSG